jgi:hypothetical protein
VERAERRRVLEAKPTHRACGAGREQPGRRHEARDRPPVAAEPFAAAHEPRPRLDLGQRGELALAAAVEAAAHTVEQLDGRR